MPLRLVRTRPPKHTLDCAQKILKDAERGRITGLAFVAFIGDAFVVDACGDARDRPKLTIEALGYLEDKLHRLDRE